MKLGKEISSIRKEHGMTQEAFGQLFHVTRQTVSNWENEKSYPDLQTLIDMSNHFGISLDMLLKEDTHMIQTIDKERHFGKRLAKGIITAISIITLVCISYCGYWYYQKNQFEQQFQNALQSYGFSQKIITDENGNNISVGSYVAQDGNIEYSILAPDFPDLLSFDTKIPDDAKFVAADCSDENSTLRLRCSPSYTRESQQDDITFNEALITLTLDQGYKENSDGTFTPILFPEYNLDENGTPYAGHLDDDTRAVYDRMKDDVQTAASTLPAMLQDFYG